MTEEKTAEIRVDHIAITVTCTGGMVNLSGLRGETSTYNLDWKQARTLFFGILWILKQLRIEEHK